MGHPYDGLPDCLADGCALSRVQGSHWCLAHARERRAANARQRGKTSDGIRTNVRKLTPEEHVALRRMWARFVPVSEIARHFGISIPTAKRYAKTKPADR